MRVASRALPVCLLALSTAFLLPSVAPAATSSLWGTSGELWSSTSRLPDFSFAGYHSGATPPTRTNVVDVKVKGAKGDGVTDDTAAFLNAIAAASNGAIYVPTGRYKITKRLILNKSNIVLKGDGPGKSVLYFPKSLSDVDGGYRETSAGQSVYSFSDALIRATGSIPATSSTLVSTVTANANRGAKTITLASATNVTVGSTYMLVQTDPAAGTANAGTLIRHLYGDLADGGSEFTGKQAFRFTSKVTAKSGNTITLERPLPLNVKTIWAPQLHRFAPTVQEVGIEGLTIEFPMTQYPGHFKEKGYNAIELWAVAHSWVRNVNIVNADYGVNINNSQFSTVDGVTINTSGDRGTIEGHHALNASTANDNLFRNFAVNKPFHHDLTVDWMARGNVFMDGSGVSLAIDHHRGANNNSLFTNLNAGDGKRTFLSGGSSNRGLHSGVYSTFWNIRSSATFPLPAVDFGPKLNFIGLNLSSTTTTSTYQWLVQAIAPSTLSPQNIYTAQRNKRLGL